jgi:hypothetical protein
VTLYTAIAIGVGVVVLLSADVARHGSVITTVPAVTTDLPVAQNASTAAPAEPKTPVNASTLDLKTLEEQLKNTKAIGFFTKLTLKGQVDDLLDEFRDYYRGESEASMTELRRSYELLMMKVLSLLQDDDPTLASAIVASRDAIWGLLADPKTFATIQG